MFYSDLSTMNYQKSHIKKIFDLLFKSGNIHYYAEIQTFLKKIICGGCKLKKIKTKQPILFVDNT